MKFKRMTIFYMHGADSRDKAKQVKGEHPHNHSKCLSKWSLKKASMAHCFEFRMRTSSFDLHQLATGHKLARISRLFRSKSQDEVKSLRSPTGSPTQSPTPTQKAPARRRFVRVVKNQECEGEEYENRHLVRRYTREYWEEQQLEKSKSVDCQYDPDHLPYTVSGHTILKKHPSVDSDSSPPVTKHACFKEDIEVIEFDKKSKIKKQMFHRFQDKLVDSSDDGTDSDTDLAFNIMRDRVKGKKAPPIEDYSSEEEENSSTQEVSAQMSEMNLIQRTKGELNLAFATGMDVANGLCSPVKEEEEDSVTDTESVTSDMSDILSDHDKRRLSSTDSAVSMESLTSSLVGDKDVREKVPAGSSSSTEGVRKHEVES